MKTRSAKNKGKKLQNLVAEKLREMLQPFGVVEGDIKSTIMGDQGEDVQLSPRARDLIPVSIECKSHARMAVYSLYEQAEKEAEGTENQPVLVIKANRKQPLVVIGLDNWLDLEYNRIMRRN